MFRAILAGIDDMKMETRQQWTKNGVAHIEEFAGFSMVTSIVIIPNCASLAANLYKQFAAATFALLTPLSYGNPSGNFELRSGFGFGAPLLRNFRFTGMFLALDCSAWNPLTFMQTWSSIFFPQWHYLKH